MTIENQEEKTRDLEAALGRSVIAWNHFEASIEMIIYGLSGGGKRTDVLTAHMSSVTLANVLSTLANDFSSDQLQPHLLHLVEGFERLREYRNYYFHGIRLIGFTEAGEAEGLAQTTSARSRLTLHQASISIAQLNEFTAACRTALGHASAVITEIWEVSKLPGAELPGLPPEMPPLPDRMQKPRLFLRDAERQLPSSQE